MLERGHRYTGEKMKQLKPRPKRAKVAAVQETDRAGLPSTHVPPRRAVMAAADRAEERSKRNRQSRPGKLTERLPSYSPLGCRRWVVSRLRRSATITIDQPRGAAYLPAAACGRSVEVPASLSFDVMVMGPRQRTCLQQPVGEVWRLMRIAMEV
jgi:hypothetical protein